MALGLIPPMTLKEGDLSIYRVHTLSESNTAGTAATNAYNKHTKLTRKHRPPFCKAY